MCRFILLFIVVLLSGCSVKEDGILSLTIDTSMDQPVPLSVIAEDIVAVHLETTDSSLIDQGIRQVDFFEDQYFVSHRGGLFVFDAQGKFLRRIGKIGKGPGEFLFSLQFAIDRKEEKIFLIVYPRGIMVYDFNGNFLERWEEIAFPAAMYWSEGMIYILGLDFKERDAVNVNFISADRNGQVRDSIFFRRISVPDPKSTISPAMKDFIFQSRGKMYLFYPDLYLEFLRDTLYVFNNGKIDPYLDVRFKYDRRPVLNIFMTERYVVAEYSTHVDDGSPYGYNYTSHYVYDTQTGKNFNAKKGFTDDIYHNKEVIIHIIPHSDKFFYYKEAEYSADTKTEQNPVLYIGTFRK